MSNNSELTQNSKEIKTLERILSFGVNIAPPLPKPDTNTNTKTALQQGSIRKRSELEQLERLIKLGLS